MPLLLAAQATLLDDMEEHFESVRDRAVDFSTHEVEDLTDELDEVGPGARPLSDACHVIGCHLTQ